MFGYVIAPVTALPDDQRLRYQAVYCGLCRALGERHGTMARMALTYDLTFLTLLLQSLYEPEERSGTGRCPRHPVKARAYAASAVSDYAADLTCVLMWHKCMDDKQDDHSAAAALLASQLRKPYAHVKERLPKLCEHVEQCMRTYSELEKSNAPGSALCDCFGRLMSELFVMREDEWSPALRSLGGDLGRMICLMDAATDYDRDLRKGHYNVLRAMDLTPEDARGLLTVLAGRVTAVLERLPLVQDLDILRSILYAGIWQRYEAAMNKRKDGNETNDKGDRT